MVHTCVFVFLYGSNLLGDNNKLLLAEARDSTVNKEKRSMRRRPASNLMSLTQIFILSPVCLNGLPRVYKWLRQRSANESAEGQLSRTQEFGRNAAGIREAFCPSLPRLQRMKPCIAVQRHTGRSIYRRSSNYSSASKLPQIPSAKGLSRGRHGSRPGEQLLSVELMQSKRLGIGPPAMTYKPLLQASLAGNAMRSPGSSEVQVAGEVAPVP